MSVLFLGELFKHQRIILKDIRIRIHYGIPNEFQWKTQSELLNKSDPGSDLEFVKKCTQFDEVYSTEFEIK